MTAAQAEARQLAALLPSCLCPKVTDYPDGGAILDVKRGGPEDPGGEGLWFNVDRPDQWFRCWAYGLRLAGFGQWGDA